MASKKQFHSRCNTATIIHTKTLIDVQRYFIADMLREKGKNLTPEQYQNWKKLHDTLLIATRVLQDMDEVRTQALIFAHHAGLERDSLRRQVEELISHR